jgi:hypothetical protein|tara:strand:+ start:1687 stop:1821 length:135 start_codon:yes stop_codon:yes gene_type:complete
VPHFISAGQAAAPGKTQITANPNHLFLTNKNWLNSEQKTTCNKI